MRIYLVDYENVHVDGLKGVELLTAEDRVVIFYTEQRSTLTFSMYRSLMESQANIQLMEVSNKIDKKMTIKNALDLQLTMYMGYLFGSNPDASVCVISKDQDFDLVRSFFEQNLQSGTAQLSHYSSISESMMAQTVQVSEKETTVTLILQTAEETQTTTAAVALPAAEVVAAVSEPKADKNSLTAEQMQNQISAALQLPKTDDVFTIIWDGFCTAAHLQEFHGMLARQIDQPYLRGIYQTLKPLFLEWKRVNLQIWEEEVLQLLQLQYVTALYSVVCRCLVETEDLKMFYYKLSEKIPDVELLKQTYQTIKPQFFHLKEMIRKTTDAA